METKSWAMCVPLLLGVMAAVLQFCSVFVQGQNLCVDGGAPDPAFITVSQPDCREGKIFLSAEKNDNLPTIYDWELDYIQFKTICNSPGGLIPDQNHNCELEPDSTLSCMREDSQVICTLEVYTQSHDINNPFDEVCNPSPADSTICNIAIRYEIEFLEVSVTCSYNFPEQWTCNYSIPCPILSNPLNGEVTLGENPIAFSDANYSCNPGYVIDGVHTRSCQVNGSWSDSEPCCVAANTSLEVILTTDASYMYAEVGSVFNLTCAVNGPPPLEVHFEEENMNHIDPNAITDSKGSCSIRQKILSYQVLKPGPLHFTCIATVNSTGQEQRSQFVNVTGVVDLNIQICFEIHSALTCNEVTTSFSDVLPDITSAVATNCGCYLPENVQNVSIACLSSCQERLFYHVAVLVDDETDLNTSLHLWASQNESLLFVGNLELTPNLTCGVLVNTSLPSPICPYTIYTTSQTTTDTVSSQTTTFKSSSSLTTSSSSINGRSENDDVLIIVLIGIVVLFFAFVILALTFVVMVCFFHKRGGTSGDFAGEGFDAHVFDQIHQLEEHSFQRQVEEYRYVDNKSFQKSVEAAQINSDFKANDSIATRL